MYHTRIIGCSLVNQPKTIQLSGGENKFVNITDSNGCEKEFAVFVPKVSSVEITSVNTFDNLCSGSVSGQIDVQ